MPTSPLATLPPRVCAPPLRVRRPPVSPTQTTAAARVQPERLVAHLAGHGDPPGAHLEYTARAGSLLGGPLAPVTRRRKGCHLLPEADLAEAHLLYLRDLYRTNSEARVLLDQLAGQLVYGTNRIAIVADSLGVARNVIRAITGLAGRLPVRHAD